jgi:hypothetical protein
MISWISLHEFTFAQPHRIATWHIDLMRFCDRYKRFQNPRDLRFEVKIHNIYRADRLVKPPRLCEKSASKPSLA